MGRQELKQVNLLKNPGFELGQTGWTGDGTLALVTSGANLYTGVSSLTWSATAAQAIISDAVTLPRGSGSTCKAWAYYKQDGENVTFRVLQSGSPIASVQLAAGTSAVQFRRTPVLEFPCETNTVNVQFLATGTVTNLAIDQVFLGVSDPDFTDNFTQSYVKDGTFENTGVHGWLMYDDGAVANPVDGTGGTASTLTFFDRRFGEGNVARDNGSFLWQKSAADGQGEGVAYAFTIEEADTNQRLRLEFEYMTNTNYVAGDVGVYIYDVDGAALIKATGVDLPKTDSTSIARKFSFEWDSTSSDDYRLIFHIKTTNAGSYFVSMDSVKISPVTKEEQAPATGEVNYLESPDVNSATFEVSAGYWSTFDDGAVADPVDGTGGTPSQLTFSRSIATSDTLRGTGVGEISKLAANAQGEGISIPITIEPGDANKLLKVEMQYRTSADYANGDLGVWMYCDLDGTPFYIDVKAGELGAETNVMFQTGGVNGVFSGTFVSPADTTDLDCRLIFMVTVTTTLAWDIQIDDVVVGPGRTLQGGIVGSWESYTLAIKDTDGGGDVTFGTNTTSSYWRRVGTNIEWNFWLRQTAAGTAGSAGYLWTLPAGLTIDTNVVAVSSSNGRANNLGTASSFNGTDGVQTGYAQGFDTDDLMLIVGDEATPPQIIGSTWQHTNSTSQTWSFHVSIPIAEYRNGGTMNALTQDNLIKANAVATAYVPGELLNFTSSDRDCIYDARGQNVRIECNVTISAASATPLQWTAANLMPSGFTIDEDVTMSSGGTDNPSVGTAVFIDDSTSQYYAGVITYDESSNIFRFASGSGVPVTAVPFTWVSGDFFTLKIEVPVNELAKTQPSIVGSLIGTKYNPGLVKVSAGTYVPTLVVEAGSCTVSTSDEASYLYINGIVIVTAEWTFNCSAGTTVLTFTLPPEFDDVTINNSEELYGPCSGGVAITHACGRVEGDTDSGNKAQIVFTSAGTGGNPGGLSFSYNYDALKN
jgi:hypothetical protein